MNLNAKVLKLEELATLRYVETLDVTQLSDEDLLRALDLVESDFLPAELDAELMAIIARAEPKASQKGSAS